MIIIKKYCNNWPVLFEQEKNRILNTTDKWVKSIDHIGSTSIPELSAKPIIDIVVCIKSLQIASSFIISALEQLGYSYIQEYESIMPDRRYFKRKDVDIAYNVHVVECNSKFYSDTILFKNILLNNKQILLQYQNLKFELMKKYDDEFEYANAKSEFINSVLSNQQ